MAISGPTVDHREIRAWADRHNVLPTELLPNVVDHVPPIIQLTPARSVRERKDVIVLTWDEFFARFDLLGLTFVYDEDQAGYNELLQREDVSPAFSQKHRADRFAN